MKLFHYEIEKDIDISYSKKKKMKSIVNRLLVSD